MKKNWIAVLALAGLFLTVSASAEDKSSLPGAEQPVQQEQQTQEAPAADAPADETPADAPAETPADAPDETPADVPDETPADAPDETPAEKVESENPFEIVTKYRSFVNKYRYRREVRVSYYDDVYACNHGEYALTPFAASVPPEYFVMDESGTLAIAPIVLDITDAMRERLYHSDVGETAMFYGQYCERQKAKDKKTGYTGIHEGIDFVNEKNAPLHAILDGVVTRAGDSNGTVGIYNAEHDITLLYLHCEKISVRRGDEVKAGDMIAEEGRKNSGAYYTHVEMRNGRHTSSSPYRDTELTSDCPYAAMQKALNVVDSGRQPITAAAVLEAKRMREEAEAAALKAAEEAEAARKAEEEAALKEEEEELVLIDNLPGRDEAYGFGADASEAPEATPAPSASPVSEATLPPVNP